MGTEQTAQQELDELHATFDRLWEAEQRGIKMWQKAKGRHLTWPDTAHFTVWLIGRLERAEKVIDVARRLGEVEISCEDRGFADILAHALSLTLHIEAYDTENDA